MIYVCCNRKDINNSYKDAKRLMKNKTCNVRINVTLRRGRETIVAKVKNKYYIFCVCVCSISYVSCIQTVFALLYNHLRPLPFHHFYLFFTLSQKEHNFRKIIFIHKSMFLFLYKCRLTRLDRSWGPPSLLHHG